MAGARQARLLAEFARRRPGDDPKAGISDHASGFSRWAPDEIGLALTLSRMTAVGRLAQARQLTEVLDDTLHAWESGLLDASKVRAITDACFRKPPEQARAIQDRVLARAPEQTLSQLKKALARAVIATDPDGAAARHQEARTDRRVRVHPAEDGMATLWACLTAPDALTCYGWLTALARGLGRDDTRTMDQRRADLLAALITDRLTVVPPDGADGDSADGDSAEAPSPAEPRSDRPPPAPPAPPGRLGWPTPVNPGKPLVQILLPHSTLTGADDHPVELVGYGPVPAPLARAITADAVWKRLVTDPLSGALLDHGRGTYRPPAALADFVRARDVTCRFPPCNRRALDGELDHTRAWTGEDGLTCEANLYGGCVHHHLKHDAPGWSVRQDPDGTITWITPTGHRYTSEPYDYRPEPASPTSSAAICNSSNPSPPAPSTTHPSERLPSRMG